jgi:hypothetical protein
MKKIAILVCTVFAAGIIGWRGIESFSTIILLSKVERLGEKDLPKVFVENGSTVYCRMKADDFRFSLPPGSRPLTTNIASGGFDWVDGSVEVQIQNSSTMNPIDYQSWISSRLQVGGWITTEVIPEGLLVKFHYFGDK